MSSLTIELSGGVNVEVTITELDGGSLQFDLVVLDDTGSIGDLNGLFFDMADTGLISGLSLTGEYITDFALKADSITKVDGYNNVNGEVANELGKFDAGVQFGTSGIGTDDIRETSFVLSHETDALTLDMFVSMDFAVRLTSVGEEGGTRDDSLKIGGTAPAVPDAPVDNGPDYIANNDTMTVSNTETFNMGDFPDPLDNFAFTILENDTQDEFVYDGEVLAANGQTFDDFIIVDGSNGGQMRFNADGTVDFSANDDFDYLTDDATATTTFSYAIEGGAEALVTVEVFADDGSLGGGGVGAF